MTAALRVVDPTEDEAWSVDPYRPATETERLFDMGAEGCVLSNCIYDPALIDEVRGLVLPEYFYSEAHRLIFESILAIVDAGEALDVVSVCTRLRAADRMAQVGGMAYLTDVLNSAPVLLPRFLRTHANTVRRLWVRRKFAELAEHAAARCKVETVTIDEIMAGARKGIDDLVEVVSASEDASHVLPLLRQTMANISAAGASAGVGARPTGFDRLDRVIAGLHVELTLIGARPGMGKTSLATAIATYVARRGEGVFVASLETVRTELMTRMLCAEARVEVQRVRGGSTTPTDWQRLAVASQAMSEIPLWVDDTPGMTVSDLWSKARRAGLQLARTGKKLGVVIVDYVQLLKAARPGMKREEVVAENARALKAMSQDLNVTVIGLAQLNREVEKRPDKRPQLSDLRDSGELEQCARTVLLLYREDYYKAKVPAYRPNGEVEVEVAKQNNGPTGLVRLGFEAPYTRFMNIDEGE